MGKIKHSFYLHLSDKWKVSQLGFHIYGGGGGVFRTQAEETLKIGQKDRKFWWSDNTFKLDKVQSANAETLDLIQWINIY